MKCEGCGTERFRLQRHHRLPKGHPDRKDPANIAKLCANCHEDHHYGPTADFIIQRGPKTQAGLERRNAAIKAWWAALTPEEKAIRRAKRSLAMRGNQNGRGNTSMKQRRQDPAFEDRRKKAAANAVQRPDVRAKLSKMQRARRKRERMALNVDG